MISLKIIPHRLLNVKSDVMVIPIFQDIIPSRGSLGRIDWLLSSRISRLILSEKFSGNYKEKGLICNSKKFITDKILLIGVGKSSTVNEKRISQISSSIIDILSNIKIHDFSMELFGKNILGFETRTVFEEMAKGFIKKNSKEGMRIHLAEEDEQRYEVLIKTAKEMVSLYKGHLTLA